MKTYTRREIRAMEATGHRPPLFTGKWLGRHYYRGVAWGGPTNLVGHGQLRLHDGSEGCELSPVGRRNAA